MLGASAGWAAALLAILGEASFRIVALVAGVGLVAVLLRRAPARLRHAMWGIALGGALAMPLLTALLPAWSLGLSPAPLAESARLAPPELLRAPPAPRPETAAVSRIPEIEFAAELSPLAEGDRHRAAAALTWSEIGSALWLAGAVGSLAWLVFGLVRVRRLAAGARPLDSAPWRRALERARRATGVRRPVRLLVTDEAVTPATWGLRRPTVLLPASAAGWSAERRFLVLLHELAHVRRGDWPLRLLARIVCSLYWFHPLAWLAARRLAIEQEIACDDEVLRLGTRPSRYAEHLLAIARAVASARPLPLPALEMARRSQMEGRLMSILDSRRARRLSSGAALPVLLLAVGLVPALAAVTPFTDPEAATERLQASGAALAGQEGRFEEFERELERVESEMAPIEAQLAAAEGDLEGLEHEFAGEERFGPYEIEMEGIEARLAPVQERMERVEGELAPYLAQVAEIEAEMEPFTDRLAEVEAEMAPVVARMADVEREMAPLAEELELAAEELEDSGVEAYESWRLLEERMGPLHERMNRLHEEMRPFHERMGRIHEEMRPLHERLGRLQEQMTPIHERLRSLQVEMAPLHEEMSRMHEAMQPMREQVEAFHRQMEPHYERMRELHESLEPHRLRMEEIHQRMEPLRREMEERYERLRADLAAYVESVLAEELETALLPDTDLTAAAERVSEASSVSIHDRRLRLRASTAELREILTDELSDRRQASEEELAAAIARAARRIADTDVDLPWD